jgi:predicted TIM-barrel fold metal-dependent hydrolase
MSAKGNQEEMMQQTGRDRRDVLWGLSAMAGVGFLGASATPATAQQVKYSSGTEPAKLKAPANACDCHHHIYGSQYKVDPRSTLRPGDATVDDYRALQKRIGTSRNVIVQPSTYGTENAPTLDALVAFGPSARARAYVKAAPERLVWGSDWPHPGVRDPEPKPDDAVLIDLMLDWAPDDAVRNRILVDNAAKLYDFPKS